MSGEHDGAGVSPKTFHDLVRERKSDVKDEANSKRLCDLTRIQEMKCREGIGPLEIFPKEIWQLIFDELSPEDRANMWQLHGIFRDIMENSHVRDNLLPQILKVNVPKFWGFPGWGIPEDLMCKRAKVPLAHYLNLRLVSKGLMNAVDDSIEAHLLEVLRQGDSYLEMPRNAVEFELSSDSPSPCMRKIDQVLGFYRENPKARLVSRSLKILIFFWGGAGNDFLETFEQFKNKMISLLEFVGGQILHLSIHVLNYSLVEAVKIRLPFYEWTIEMPNLKWLQLWLACYRPLENSFDMDALRRQPLPNLKHIERIDMDILPMRRGSEVEAEAFSRTVLETNPQIKHIRVPTDGFGVLSLSSMNLPKLESCELGSSLFIRNNILNAINLEWKLRQLDLSLDLKDNESMDSVNAIVNLVLNFPALEKLKLRMKNVKIGGDMDFLKLTHLKELELELVTPIIDFEAPIQFFFCLQFLLHCKNLSKLTWTINSLEMGKLKDYFEEIALPQNMIDFQAGNVDLETSNIWKVFPRMKYVKVTKKELVCSWYMRISAKECHKGQVK